MINLGISLPRTSLYGRIRGFRQALALMVILVFTNLPGDTEKDFTFRYVRDFAKVSEHPRMTFRKQHALAKMRVGTYMTFLHDEANEFMIPTGCPKRLFVSVTTNDLVMLFFEDSEGRLVSRHDFLEGKISDESFYWGHPMHGVAARYGILRDTMLLLISPRWRQIALVLKRQNVRTGEIKKLADIKCLAEMDCGTADIFSMICETEVEAAEARLLASTGGRPSAVRTVAFYAEDANIGSAHCRVHERVDRSHEFMVMRNDGEFRRIMTCVDGTMKSQPYLLFAWWNEFDGTAPCQTGLFYAVRRNSISTVGTAFEISRHFDQMVIMPSFYQRNPEKICFLEDCVKRLLDEPMKLFWKKRYIRIANEPENMELRAKLDNIFLR